MPAYDLTSQFRQQVSFDGGHTWIDANATTYEPQGFTVRVVDFQNHVLWVGTAAKEQIPCKSCGGTGKQDTVIFRAGPPVFQEKK